MTFPVSPSTALQIAKFATQTAGKSIRAVADLADGASFAEVFAGDSGKAEVAEISIDSIRHQLDELMQQFGLSSNQPLDLQLSSGGEIRVESNQENAAQIEGLLNQPGVLRDELSAFLRQQTSQKWTYQAASDDRGLTSLHRPSK